MEQTCQWKEGQYQKDLGDSIEISLEIGRENKWIG